jgi:2-keto-3-deoxy-L-rhamnonate aldolase RhmA
MADQLQTNSQLNVNDRHRSAGGVLAAAEPFCLVMSESAGALAELDAIVAVDGVDGL